MCIWWLAKIQKCFAYTGGYRITQIITTYSVHLKETASKWNTFTGWSIKNKWKKISSLLYYTLEAVGIQVRGKRCARLTNWEWGLLLAISCWLAPFAWKWIKLPSSASPRQEVRGKITSFCLLSVLVTRLPFLRKYSIFWLLFHPSTDLQRNFFQMSVQCRF